MRNILAGAMYCYVTVGNIAAGARYYPVTVRNMPTEARYFFTMAIDIPGELGTVLPSEKYTSGSHVLLKLRFDYC